MIKYDKLWETMQQKGITFYDLTAKHGVSKSLLSRMKHNNWVSTHSLNMLCNILDCNIEDIATFYKDESAPDK